MKLKLIILLLILVSKFIRAQNTDFWDDIESFDGPTKENPILAAQLDFYFGKMVSPLPDSITLEISRLVDRTSYNPNLRDFILWHLLEQYQHPEYMTHDQVFVYLYDHYFSQLEIKELNATNLALIRDRAETFRRLALFNLAPNFAINDSVDLQSVESKYAVLFFYDHDCDVCHQQMRELDSVCTKHPEITALAIDVNPDSSGENSSGFAIRPQGNGDLKSLIQYRRMKNPSELIGLYDIEATPLIYVLDRDKRIIAKKLRAKQIPLFL